MSQVEMTTAQLADRLGVTARMINIYKVNAEATHNCGLGTKRGRTTYFSPEEQEMIERARSQQNGHSAENARQNHAQRQAQDSQNFQTSNAKTEGQILDGMGDLVTVGDRNALALGEQLGRRWSGLVMTSALQAMQQGLSQVSVQLEELGTAMNCSFVAPQLPESSQSLLPSSDDDF